MEGPLCALGSQPFDFCPNRSISRNVDDCENKSLAITDLLRQSIPAPMNKVLRYDDVDDDNDDNGDDDDDHDSDDDDDIEKNHVSRLPKKKESLVI